MKKFYNDGAELVKFLNTEKRITHQELADFLGVKVNSICLWKNGSVYCKPFHYRKLQKMVEALRDVEVKYPHQAIDILKGRLGENDV